MSLKNLILIGFFLTAGCATTKHLFHKPGPVTLRIDGVDGRSSETRYYNVSRILTYEDQQLVRDRTEAVDFTVVTNIKSKDPKDGTIKQSLKTTRKDGVIFLHDLAFPENGESIDYTVKASGEVLKAGRYPKQSIFYVPSMPIPAGPVEIGDTWTLEHVWRSARDGVPLKLEVVAILKDLVSCEKDSLCADIELSGHVNLLIPPDEETARFSSRLWGRLLFSIARGDVIWSETRSREDMVHSGGRVMVSSCMISKTKVGEAKDQALTCGPDGEKLDDPPEF